MTSRVIRYLLGASPWKQAPSTPDSTCCSGAVDMSATPLSECHCSCYWAQLSRFARRSLHDQKRTRGPNGNKLTRVPCCEVSITYVRGLAQQNRLSENVGQPVLSL
ncbi:hypothetical protein BB8028_0007g02560 [Beauveria bassiana]|uniref:Uncharacterized protein n=1 Tax=Beauveria bassiana TaxID=176275 RepID=A0A2S7YLV0_BEABA|nr:hypothetical protein BB8028_0007g02560 [Beauveria bassiana]